MRKGYKVPTAWINSEQAKSVAEYYTEGHTVQETADHFGITKSKVNDLAKRKKLTNGRKFAGLEKGQKTKHNEEQTKQAEARLKSRLESFGLEYIGGYQNRQSTITCRCTACGEVREYGADFVQKGKALVCKRCEKRKTARRQAEQRRIAKEQAEVKAIERKWRRTLAPKADPYDEMHEAFLNRAGVCEICGKPYTVRSYVESCGLKKAQDNGVCSAECRRVKNKRAVRASKKRRGVRDSHRRRAKRNGCEYDPSVTLKRLVERDGLRCAICGKMCDPSDHSWGKYSGPLYPSIDHIIPISHGGGHVWENVQVAHIICNSYKGDHTEEAV